MTVVEEIQKLKQEKNAVILAHYYVRPEIQDIADYIGDSFYLSKVAVGLKEQTIVFCGVSFMGESAKVLNPEKTVLMPDMHADCAMAHMADAKTIQKMRDTYEDLAVVCYINSTAELKTHSDVCVTSANAVKIVKALPNNGIVEYIYDLFAKYGLMGIHSGLYIGIGECAFYIVACIILFVISSVLAEKKLSV